MIISRHETVISSHDTVISNMSLSTFLSTRTRTNTARRINQNYFFLAFASNLYENFRFA